MIINKKQQHDAVELERECKKVKGNPIHIHIPYEVVFNILTYVPVKHLLQFRSVSKQWLSIISDPKFVQSHLDKAKEINNPRLKRHMSIVTKSRPSIKSINCESLDCENLSLPFADKTNNNIAELLGSCNGLVLVGTGEKDHFLWNPSTRAYKQIPCAFYHNKYHIRCYGFGYDSLTDAYKIIRIVRVTSYSSYVSSRHDQRPYHHYIYDSTNIRVYNSKTNCWRKITKFPYKVLLSRHGVLVNGAPHWVVAREGIIQEYAIIYFDLAEERFKEVDKPSWLVIVTEFNLWVWRGLLCLVKIGHPAEVWVMKEYGVGKSWTKVFSTLVVNDFVPLCFRKNDEELIMERFKCVLINYKFVNDQRYQILNFGKPTSDIVLNSTTYVESLVSPQGSEF